MEVADADWVFLGARGFLVCWMRRWMERRRKRMKNVPPMPMPVPWEPNKRL